MEVHWASPTTAERSHHAEGAWCLEGAKRETGQRLTVVLPGLPVLLSSPKPRYAPDNPRVSGGMGDHWRCLADVPIL